MRPLAIIFRHRGDAINGVCQKFAKVPTSMEEINEEPFW